MVASVVSMTAILVSGALAGAQASPGGGGSYAGATSADDKLTAEVRYQDLIATPAASDGTRRTTPTRPVTCEVHEAPGGPDGGGSENDTLTPFSGTYVDAAWYYQTCRYADTGELINSNYWQYAPGDPTNPGPDLAALARQAYDEVPLGFPVPATSPGLDKGDGGETADTDSDGETVTCDGPGTPYDPAVADGAQSTECSHVYQDTSVGEPDGRYPASVTVDWSVDWDSSTGATGTLADASRTTTFALTVTERQAVVSYVH